VEFNYFDLTILVPLLFGMYKGFTKGLILSVATLVGLVLGVWAGVKFSHITSEVLFEKFQLDIPLLAFAVTFLAVLIGMYFLGKLLSKFIDILALGLFNKIGGAIFSACKTILILAVVLLFFENVNSNFNLVDTAILDDSIFYPFLKGISKYVFPYFNDLKSLSNVTS
jgi:membrane protein required for colicin V production